MKIQMILPASGFGRRYGSNKLLALYKGEPLYARALELLLALRAHPRAAGILVATQYPEIETACEEAGVPWVHNEEAAEGICASIRLGVRLSPADVDGYLFCVADQPELKKETIGRMLDAFEGGILMAAAEENGKLIPGNPVIFDASYREELLSLTGDTGGRQIIRMHPEAVHYFLCDAKELTDIDQPV